MLGIYEGRNQDRKLVRRIEGETIEIAAINGYLIWLKLMAENKLILEVFVSPYQLGRLGKYLADSTWRGGIICPRKSQPEDCYIRELNDQARYRQILKDINYHRSKIEEYKGMPEAWSDYHQKQLSTLELEALMLEDSTRFGLVFDFWLAKPEVEVEWLLEDPQAEAKEFLEVTKLAYGMREPEPMREIDLTDWKHKLFEV